MPAFHDILAGLAFACLTATVVGTALMVAAFVRDDRRRAREDEEVARLEALFDLDEVLAEQQVADLEALWRLPAAKRTA